MDKTYEVICFGEVLWDNLPQGRRIGGAPLNVCYHLNQNGIASAMISQIGIDQPGKDLRAGLKELGLDDEFIPGKAAYPTSVVEVHLQSQGQVSYEIVENVAWDFIEFHEDIAQIIQESSFFVFGSLAARSAQTRATLLRYLPYSPWPVFDVNLRQHYFTNELIISLIEQTKTLKVNEEEILLIASWLGFKEEYLEDYPARFLHRFPLLQEIILTKGGAGAYYENRESSHSVYATEVAIKDTVGAGDSFLAAFLAKKINGSTLPDALSHASRISGFVASCAGACPVYPRNLLG